MIPICLAIRQPFPLARTILVLLTLHAATAHAAGVQHFSILAESMKPLDSSIFSIGKFVLILTVNTDIATMDNTLYSYGVVVFLPKATGINVSVPNLAILRVVVDWSYLAFLSTLQK